MPASALTRSGRGRRRRTKPRATVVVPVFNQSSVTAECLRALAGTTAAELIVVDDGSTDATPQLLASCDDRLRVVTHRANRGFAASCNDGAGAATAGEFLVFLNNDTVPQPGWLEALVGYADAHPSAAVVGSKLLFPDDTIQHAGVVICQDRHPRHIYAGFPADHPAVNRARRFQIVTAACMLVRRRVFERAGGFDTAFRNGFEDVDLCLRLGEDGREIHYCPASTVYHLESVSPGRFRRDRHNVALYRRRWLARVQPDDLGYYQEDGLLRLDYEGRYPFTLEVSPLLATLDGVGRGRAAERLLRERSREVAELRRENTRLSLALGRQGEDSPERRYRRLRERIREVVRQQVPPGATVLVISKGDGALLDLPGRRGWHFPRAERGAYAGHHPGSSLEAITHLEALRARGGGYLLIPATARWWLDHYTGFRRHLESRYRRLAGTGDPCWVYALSGGHPNPSNHAPSRITV
jgi:GT2 family glycosyltransferase